MLAGWLAIEASLVAGRQLAAIDVPQLYSDTEIFTPNVYRLRKDRRGHYHKGKSADGTEPPLSDEPADSRACSETGWLAGWLATSRASVKAGRQLAAIDISQPASATEIFTLKVDRLRKDRRRSICMG